MLTRATTALSETLQIAGANHMTTREVKEGALFSCLTTMCHAVRCAKCKKTTWAGAY